MPNPFTSNDLFRSLKNRFKKKSDPETTRSASQLALIWPDGTWQLDGIKDFDNTIRGVLLDVYANEKFFSAQKSAGRDLNPGMFGQQEGDVPAGWLPSESGIDHLWARNKWQIRFQIYVVSQLRDMGKLVP